LPFEAVGCVARQVTGLELRDHDLRVGAAEVYRAARHHPALEHSAHAREVAEDRELDLPRCLGLAVVEADGEVLNRRFFRMKIAGCARTRFTFGEGNARRLDGVQLLVE